MEKLLEITRKFPGKKVVVIGDVMLDQYIHGDVSRISPEAPVQVVKVKRESFEPGGAANVAANISSLGGQVTLFGFVGGDESARILSKILEERGIEYHFGASSMTTVKKRPTGRGQQLLRIDYEDASQKEFDELLQRELKESVNSSDIIVISDYSKGTVTPSLMNFLKSTGKRIIVDVKPENAALYSRVYLVKTNEQESLALSGKPDFQSAGRYIREVLGANAIITRAEKGMALFCDKEIEIPTYAREVYDVTGAGDTALSAIALSLAAGSSLEEAAIIGNHAAGIAVSRAGTYQVKLDELEKNLSGEESKIKNFLELSEIVKGLKKRGKRIVWTNGCFDLLHEGHVKYLAQAKSLGDFLLVGLNSDSSVRLLKGPDRPINSENSRAEILSALACVDYVMIFSEPEVTKYLEAFEPHFYVKGAGGKTGYSLETVNQHERQIVESYGGRIELIDVGKDISASRIIDRIRSSETNKKPE